MALSDNLVAAWNFNESSGNAADGTGNGRTGVATNGATFAAGKLNNAGSLDGSNDYFLVSDNADLDFGTGAISISFWIYGTNYTDYTFIFEKFSGGVGYVIQQVPGTGSAKRLQMFVQDAGGQQLLYSTNDSHSINTREHWVYTRSSDGAVMKVYKDGTLNNSATGMTARNGDNATNLAIGYGLSYGAYAWAGKIDMIYIWKGKELTDGGISLGQTAGGEVAELYNGGAGLEYPFTKPYNIVF